MPQCLVRWRYANSAEQARGDIDQLDEHADVYALGHSLQILTGRPYVGSSGRHVLQQVCLDHRLYRDPQSQID